VIVEQPKPMEINVNITGHLDLVIQDARQNVEKINGEKPTNVVRPRTSVCLRGGRGRGSSEARNTKHETRNTKQDARDYVQAALLRRQSHAAVCRAFKLFDGGASRRLDQVHGGPHAQIRALWDSKVVGEAHNGLLAARGVLTPEQQKLVDAENADRTAL